MDTFFKFATPIVYWILIIVWASISIFYFKKIRLLKGYGKFLKLLLIILAIDAARTFFESLYFGAWYTSYSGLLPIGLYNFLANPEIVFIPKIINLIIAFLILFLIIKRWLEYELVEINETFDKQGFEIKKLSSAVNQSANSIVITDLNGNIEYTNPKFTEITGYTAEEALGKNPNILNSGQQSKEFYSNMWEIISGGEIWSGEFKNKKKNGKFYWEEATISPIKNDAGEIINYLAIKKDISELKENEKILKEKNIELSQLSDKLTEKNRQLFDSENKFKKLFNKSPVSIMEQDFSEAIKLLNKKKAETSDIETYLNENLSFVKKCVSKIEVKKVNEITLSLLGVKSLEELKIHFIKTNTEKSFISLKNELASIALGKKDFYGETEFVKSDGTILHAMIKSTMINDKGKNIASIVDITEITKVQEELIKAKEQANSSLQQIKVIQANTPNVIWKWDIDKVENFKNCYISEVADKFLALPEGSIGNSMDKFLSYILPEYIPLVDEAIKNAIKNPNKLISIEYEVKKADGKEAWFSSSGKVVPENGKLAIYGSTIDITEKKQIEQKLLQSDRVFNLTLDMFCIAGFDGYFKYLNPAWEKTLGWSIEELLTKPWLDFVHPDDAENTENIKSVIVDGKEVYKFENRYICKDSSIKWLSWNSQPFPKENIMIGAVRDITEAKRLENELLQAKEKAQESENKLLEAQELSHVGSWEYIVDTDAVAWSKELYNIFEHPYNLPPPNFSEQRTFYTAESFARLQKAVEDCLQREIPYEIGLDIFTSSGSIKHIISKGEIKKENNKIVGSYGTAQDVTVQKQLDLELILAKEQAEESDKLKSAFLANMSHEIRTPMNGILGFSELLKNPHLSDSQQQKYIGVIEKSGNRMLNIINDIVDISKIEAGLMDVNLNESNINEQIEYIYTFFKPEVEKKGMQFFFKNTLSAKEATIKTDKEKLFAILTNLVKNAIKYSNEGSIEFGYVLKTGGEGAEKSKKAELEFFIKDTGIGVPKDRQLAIFERFIQVDVMDKMARQGAGLGLSITKSYIEMLGGQIWLESEEGVGSTFYFTLPYILELEVKNSINDIEVTFDMVNQVENLKILIAEDDELSLEVLSAYVSEISHEIIKARTGTEAVEICRNNPDIDLILMDIQMPEMNGHEATRQIRQFNKKVIIIAQTAFGLTGDREKSLDAGCNDYIRKPINKLELDSLIQKYFKK